MSVDPIAEALRNSEPIHLSSELPSSNGELNRSCKTNTTGAPRSSQIDAQSQFDDRFSCYVDPNWTEEMRCEFEERAAIIEYDGRFTRSLAEFIAAGIVDTQPKQSK